MNGSVTVVPGGSLNIGVGSTGTISGNVRFADAFPVTIRCGGTIQGSVTMSGNTPLAVLDSVTVGGSVTIINVSHTGELFVNDSTVGGNITLSGVNNTAGDALGDVGVSNDIVHGSVSIHDNTLASLAGDAVDESGNTIGGANQVYNNTVADGAIISSGEIASTNNRVGGRALFQGDIASLNGVSNNTITGNLDCSGNVQAPSGSGNSASKKTGQCAGL